MIYERTNIYRVLTAITKEKRQRSKRAGPENYQKKCGVNHVFEGKKLTFRIYMIYVCYRYPTCPCDTPIIPTRSFVKILSLT